VQIVCPACDAINRIPLDKPAGEGRCGKCHKELFNGMPLELTAERFERHLQQSGIPLLVDFWAAWCSPCKMMAPVFVQAARQLQPGVRLAKVNTEKEQELAARYGIMSIPTIVLFKNGHEQARISGAMDLQRLLAWVQQHNI
jgi:thioredoxin 2